MGNEVCCADKGPDLGFTDKLQMLKTSIGIEKSEADLKTNEQSPKHKPTKRNISPIQNQSEINSEDMDSENSSQYLSHVEKKWKTNFQQLKQRFLTTVQDRTSFLSKKCWQHIFDSFQNNYVTFLDKLQILKFLFRMLKANFKIESQANMEDDWFDVDMDETEFSIQMFDSFKAIKTRIEKRKNQISQYLTFLKQFSHYPLDFSASKQLAKKLSDYCKTDMNAFSFLTLYLVCCVNKQLHQNPSQIFTVIKTLQNIFNELSNQHPPGIMDTQTEQDFDKQSPQENKSPKQTQYDTCVQYPVVKYKSNDADTKSGQISQYIIEKAIQAKRDLSLFSQLIRPECLKNGKEFKCALKIKGNEDSLPVVRSMQKITFSKHSDKFLARLDENKAEIIDFLQANESERKSDLFVEKWIQLVDELYSQILADEDSFQFSIGDLLRGKAMFRYRKNITETVKAIQKRISMLKDPRFAILRTQNKLDEATKDYKMILKINETIAELQLVKQMDLASNQFNHKIYELKRSKSLTPLFSLNILNKKLCKQFFIDQIEYFSYLNETNPHKYDEYSQLYENLSNNYLSKNVDFFDDLQFGEEMQKIWKDIEDKLVMVNLLLEKGYEKVTLQDQVRRRQQQSENDAQFYK